MIRIDAQRVVAGVKPVGDQGEGKRTPARPSFVRRTLALFVGLLVIAGATSTGQPANPRQVKAAFVLNFLQFVEWPGSRTATLTIGVLGDDDLASALASGPSRRVTPEGGEVHVRRLARPEEARGVQLLFIGGGEQPRLPAILRSVDGQPVLTVGDTLGFAQAGVMLNLYTFDQRVRIEVNTAAAARAQLKLSSHLLRLARIVE